MTTQDTRIYVDAHSIELAQQIGSLCSATPLTPSQAFDRAVNVAQELVADHRMGYRHFLYTSMEETDGPMWRPMSVCHDKIPLPLDENFNTIAQTIPGDIDPVILSVTRQQMRQIRDISSFAKQHVGNYYSDQNHPEHSLGIAFRYVSQLAYLLHGDRPLPEKKYQLGTSQGSLTSYPRLIRGLNF